MEAKDFVVTLHGWAIVAGDVTVSATDANEALATAKAEWRRAAWPVSQTGDHVFPSEGVGANYVAERGREWEAWLDEKAPLPINDGWALAELQRVRERANTMECLLAQAVEDWQQFDNDDDVNGGDLVDWFSEWRARVKAMLDA